MTNLNRCVQFIYATLIPPKISYYHYHTFPSIKISNFKCSKYNFQNNKCFYFSHLCHYSVWLNYYYFPVWMKATVRSYFVRSLNDLWTRAKRYYGAWYRRKPVNVFELLIHFYWNFNLKKKTLIHFFQKEEEYYPRPWPVSRGLWGAYNDSVSPGLALVFVWSFKLSYHACKGKQEIVPELGGKKQPTTCLHGQPLNWNTKITPSFNLI